MTSPARSGLELGVSNQPANPPANQSVTQSAGHDCRAGQIRRSHPARPGAYPRLFLLAAPAGPIGDADRYWTAHLLSPDTDMDTGAEQHLSANPAMRRPYHLLVHEFPTYLDTTRLGPVLWQPTKSEYLPRYSDLAALMTPGDARWQWKTAELDDANAHMVRLCCLFGECGDERSGGSPGCSGTC